MKLIVYVVLGSSPLEVGKHFLQTLFHKGILKLWVFFVGTVWVANILFLPGISH